MTSSISTNKPLKTIRLDQASLDAHLDRLEADDARAKGRRENERFPYRVKSVVVAMQQPGAGTFTPFQCPPRNIGRGGLGCLHGGYVHTGTRCNIQLFTSHGTWQDVSGTVISCRHIEANVHILGIEFDQEIEVGMFCAAAVKYRVLLYENVHTLARLAAHHLAKLNAEATLVTDMESAMSHAQENLYDVIFVDLETDTSMGFELVRHLRNQGYTGVVVAVTGRNDMANQQETLEAGFDRHLTKPYTQREISDLLDSLREEPLYSTLQDDPEMTELIEAYTEELSVKARDIQVASIKQNLKELALSINWLRDTGGSYGFSILSEQALKVSTRISNNSPAEELQSMVTELVKLCGQVRT